MVFKSKSLTFYHVSCTPYVDGKLKKIKKWTFFGWINY